jgi:hypothetical protein
VVHTFSWRLIFACGWNLLGKDKVLSLLSHGIGKEISTFVGIFYLFHVTIV